MLLIKLLLGSEVNCLSHKSPWLNTQFFREKRVNMIIPFVNLNAQYLSIKEEVDNAIGSVIRDSAFISGKYVKSFEEHFASYVNAKHCIGVGNGTDALFIALKTISISLVMRLMKSPIPRLSNDSIERVWI